MKVGRLKEILNTINDDTEIKVSFTDYSKNKIETKNLFIKRVEVLYTDTQFVTDEDITLIIREKE